MIKSASFLVINNPFRLAQVEWGSLQNAWWFAAPLVLLALLIGQRRQVKIWIDSLGNAAIQKKLLPGYNARRGLFLSLLPVFALLLLAVAALNPRVAEEKGSGRLRGMEWVLVLDVSNSMLSTDVAPNRLEQARLIARQLLDTLKGSRVAIVVFAGEAWVQLPLTSDLQAARLLLASLDTKSVPLEGTNLSDALVKARQSIPVSDASYKAAVLLTDGEQLEGDALDQAEEMRKDGISIISVGMGTPAGVVLKDEFGAPYRDEEGGEVVSRLNEAVLEKLARITSGAYISPGNPGQVAAAVLKELSRIPEKPLVNSHMVNYSSYSHWLMAAAGLILLLTGWWSGKIPAFRRMMRLSCFVMALGWTGSAAAQTLTQQSQARLEKADEWYRQGKITQAEKMYLEVLAADSMNWHAILQLGNIAGKRGDWEGALKQYEVLRQRPVPEAASAVYLNNAGLALAHSGRTEAAVAAFRKALKSDPDDAGIIRNLNMALDELRRSSARPPAMQPDHPDAKKAESRLNALQEEEKKIRRQLQQKKSTARGAGRNW